ncbi:GGDEF domain-containing phosphodiesterase [Selenomonas sputigena]|uniref:GGDEF domain-containing phosphodiesterase n=1 Tax=Selenomonas sputigena TaxID=69823 RepID=A0ABV3X5N5_9FIRM
MARFTVEEVRRLKENLAPIYDIVRFVDVAACAEIYFEDDGSIQLEGHCFSTWGRSRRCRHCTSFCASKTQSKLEKDEIMGDQVFHVLSAPVEVVLAGGDVVSCAMELVTKYPRNEALREMRDRDLLQLLSRSIKRANAGAICFNVEDECIYANLEAYRLFQVPPGELLLLQRFFNAWVKDESAEDPEKNSASWEQDFFIAGEKFTYVVTGEKLFDVDSRYKGYYYSVYDKNQEEPGQQDTRWALDKLTGLYNDEGFYEAVREELDYGLKGERCIVCSNIKDFKLVNELFGQEKGNEILKGLADFFVEIAMDSGVCGRLHGDHFAAYVEKGRFSEKNLLTRLELIAKCIDSKAYKLNIHLGIYEIQEPGMPVSVMCDRAHLALTLLRNENSCRIAYYDDALMERTLREKEILGGFDAGLAKKEFAVYLQPQVSVEGALLGAEALVRWKHPEKGLLTPGQFIGILENAGLVHLLDHYVWEEAAALLGRWQGTEKERLHLSVNISVRDLLHIDIYQTMLDIVKRHGIEPRKLKLEITETALMSDIERYRSLIGQLQDAGFEVEIDDFGSGYSSLSMLKDIEADILKIDMGFLRQTGNPRRSAVILDSVIAMSKSLGMRVITEGVETQEQVDCLRELGSDMFQGYFFAKPMPVEEFEAKYFG